MENQSPTDLTTDPVSFLREGLSLTRSEHPHLILPLAARALAENPGSRMWQSLVDLVLNSGIPDFHGRMLRDVQRNLAYRRAIDLLAKDRVVLDIGTGSGLLAMMAARAGAAKVYACEENPRLAANALQVIAANGLSDRITLLPCHSGQLSRERDLGGGVDMVISEIFSETLIGEGVLPSLAHARSELCVPDALFLPERASIEMGLADFERPQPLPDTIEGFDIREAHKVLRTPPKMHFGNGQIHRRSNTVRLFDFDFSGSQHPASHSEAAVSIASTGGRVAGAAQWISLQFAPDITYENAPGGEHDLHWVVNLVPLEERVDTQIGEELGWQALYTDTTLAIWPD